MERKDEKRREGNGERGDGQRGEKGRESGHRDQWISSRLILAGDGKGLALAA